MSVRQSSGNLLENSVSGNVSNRQKDGPQLKDSIDALRPVAHNGSSFALPSSELQERQLSSVMQKYAGVLSEGIHASDFDNIERVEEDVVRDVMKAGADNQSEKEIVRYENTALKPGAKHSFIEKHRHGNWTGKGYGAGVEIPSFIPLTKAMKAVNGVDRFDDISRQHDLDQDRLQNKLIRDILSNKSYVEAFGSYYGGNAEADGRFLAAVGKLDEKQSLPVGGKEGEGGNAKPDFSTPWAKKVKAAGAWGVVFTQWRYGALSRGVARVADYMDRGRTTSIQDEGFMRHTFDNQGRPASRALLDVNMKLEYLVRETNGRVVGEPVRQAINYLIKQSKELGGDPYAIIRGRKPRVYLKSFEDAKEFYHR